MENFFQETARMMDKAWEPFRQSMGSSKWPPISDHASRARWSPWIKATREICDVNMTAWNLLAEQSEDVFLKLFKDSPLCPSTLEARVRKMNQVLRNAGKKQQEVVTSSLDELAVLFTDRQEEPEP